MAIAGLPSGLNLGIVGISLMIFVLGLLAFVAAWKVKKSDKLAAMYREAREQNLPIISVVDLAGYSHSALGVVNDAESVYFGDKLLSLRVRPSFLTNAEPVIDEGIRRYFYFGNWYFPTNIRAMGAMLDIVEAIHTQFTELSFIKDDIALITSIAVDDGEDLKYNCEQLLKDFEQEEYLLVDGKQVQKIDRKLVGNELTINTTDEEGNEIEDVICDSEGNAIVYYNVEYEPVADKDGNPVYVKNPSYVDHDKLLSIMKQARTKILNMNLRTGTLPVKRVMHLIPGKADGKNIDTIVKIEVAKNDMKHQSEDKTMKWAAIGLLSLAAMIIGTYLIYTLFPAAQRALS